MLGLGPTELIVIFFVALIVLGPKKLPQIARTIGRGITQFKRAMNSDDDDPPSSTDYGVAGPPSSRPPQGSRDYGATGEDETEENASSYGVDDGQPVLPEDDGEQRNPTAEESFNDVPEDGDGGKTADDPGDSEDDRVPEDGD